ncbi:periplasmic chaperone for outer membrane proteins SurA [Winogradskyella epiphytica]|uniref:Periplasmic chaperone for outer membrane proteins SurA n=2 Tax=Winogradskyella epiphytica TaxID=262005 RepID=A0A2V4X5I7_9FLAO|nr:periplasmic chaperone for outer membrane proteins SurA [Winogradskyella epiphytica]GGW70630.1 peptidylprolyl isomerase [Winogradskyella epiphytica]
MPLKTINSKLIIKAALVVCFLSFNYSSAQEIIEDEKPQVEKTKDSITNQTRIKADGVAAVVGDYIILESDLDREIAQLKAQGANLEGYSRCELFGSLLESKLYAHQAIQDSIVVNELYIQQRTDQQIQGILAQTKGDMEGLLKFYKKDSEQALREEMNEINRNGYLAQQMQEKVTKDIEVTPEEVRTFFNDIPKEERPVFGTELKLAQIVIIPEVTEQAKQDVIDKLNEFKRDVEENGANFTTKVLFYTEDSGSKSTGGKYTLNRKQPRMVKEFRDVAFSMQEGEISEPFATEFGYHIILLEKIRGQEYDVRHILLRPELTQESIQKAKDKIDEVRAKIVDGTLTFAEAAREFSDEEETKFEGGQLTNPMTQDFNFELTRMEPELYAQIQDLKDGEISEVFQDEDRVNRIKFKILTVTDRIDDHEADFAKDYLKIKNLALQDKQIKAVEKWQKETIADTYIKINGEYRDCDFNSNWLKK